MHDPREEPDEEDEIDLEPSLAAGSEPALAGNWPDFETALDDQEPQPEHGDFWELERSDDGEE